MIYVNQSYVTIELDTEIDLSAGSAPKIKYKKPSGVTGEWTATVVSTRLTYELQDGDINQAGTWRLQGEITIDSRKAVTDAVNLVVKKEFE
jgi:hypothetical protein